VLLTSIGIVALVLLTYGTLRHGRLVRALRQVSEPAELAGTAVRLGELGDAAFVAGIRHPAIYCDQRLVERLTPRQLDAVLLHEQAHQHASDPARLALLGLLAPVVRRLPSGRLWLVSVVARREIEADRYALDHGASRADLAAALLVIPSMTRPLVAGFPTAVDLRLQVLLGDREAVPTPCVVGCSGRLLVGLVVGAAVCTWVLHGPVTRALTLLCC
jgi:Zn-dependent protease with chaperone function